MKLRYWWFLVSLTSVAIHSSGAAALTAEVRNTSAGPILYINGQPSVPTMFFVSPREDKEPRAIALGEIKSAAKQGVNLVSFDIYIKWVKEGETPNYHKEDAFIEEVLAANPQALLLPRIGVNWPPEWWTRELPDELMLFHDGSHGVPSVHSTAFRNGAAKSLARLIAHLEGKYGDRMMGYHPAGQCTGEWFYTGLWEGKLGSYEPPAMNGFRRYLKENYGSVRKLRLAWGDPDITFDKVRIPTYDERAKSGKYLFRDPSTQQAAIDFHGYENEVMGDMVERMCRVVKETAPKKLAVVFYGYHFELAEAPHGLQSSGHLALSRVLNSPYVDMICSPVSYLDRGAGGGGFFMAPVDSVQLHGKLWLIEDDTRTYLSPADSGFGRVSDARETYGVLSRNAAHMLTHKTAIWWMDLPCQGWFASDDLWQHISRLRRAYESSMPGFRQYRPEIAVIIDERSCFYGPPSSSITSPQVYHARTQLYRIGAPLGFYLLDDLVAGKVPPAKLYIFLDTYRLDESQIKAIRQHACKGGAMVLWMYAPGIIRGNRMSTEFISEVTGIRSREGPARENVIIDAAGESFTAAKFSPTPTFIADDAAAQVLARYAGSSDAAVVSKRMGDWTSVYSGALQLPSRMLRDMARQAGAHVFSDQDDVVMAGNGFVALHASTEGRKTIRLPGECAVSDGLTGDELGSISSLTWDMKKGDTKILRIQATSGSRSHTR